jgi:predicted O-linked N-acetylglucosamine transferase (SPINDLY family)
VITCETGGFPGRVGASLLMALGLPELVTRGPAAYEALALRLAGNPPVLAAVRSRLKAALPTSPLFDTQRHTESLQDAYRQMVERSHHGLAPAGFSV